MTPKEKAKELVENFTQYASWGIFDEIEERDENAKQCALKAVDEILDFVHPNCVDYILTVREEIEKL